MRRGSTYHLSFIKTCLSCPALRPWPLRDLKPPYTTLLYCRYLSLLYALWVRQDLVHLIHYPFLPPPTYTDNQTNYYRLCMSFDVLPI